jgi:glycosyltransferase involved in cell wall biosynthesis
MIHLLQDPNFLPTIFSPALAEALTGCGLKADFLSLGRRRTRGRVRNTILQCLYAASQTRLFVRKPLQNMSPGDIAVVYESATLASRWLDCGFQHALVRKRIRYLPVFPDAWPLTHSWLCGSCSRRIELSTAVACVTPELVSLFRDRFPGKNVVLMEEPVPTERFRPVWTASGIPVICWSGPPQKLKEATSLLPVLESVFRKVPFRLRIVSGSRKPEFPATPVPVEWMSFDETDYASRFSDVDIAFARYRDTPYGVCKGNYKIKTYMAAGCAVVTSPVGYNRDLIRPGETGLFAKTRDEWEQAFLRLLQIPDERLAMRKAARAEAVVRFSQEAIAKKYTGVLAPLGVE